MGDRLAGRLRSLLYLSAASRAWPGTEAADALLLDISGSDTDTARFWTRDAIAACGGERVFVRVSSAASGRLEQDLAAVLPARPRGVMLSDVTGPSDVEELGARLRVSEAELGRADGETRVIPLISTPAGVLALAGGKWPAGRIAAYAWEPLNLRFSRGPPNETTRLARSLTILVAARDGVPAVDPLPASDAADDAFRHACDAALVEGAGGRIVRTGAQAAIANAAFAAWWE